jgi:CheY-like chemotaxis protein
MPQSTRKILLVEDHLDTVNAMARLLHMTGFEVKTATTYAGALKACDDSATYDLLISDVGLPDGSGYDLMREMLDRRCATRGIAVSGYGAEADVQQALEAGFSAHLVKPVEFDALQNAIRRLIPD